MMTISFKYIGVVYDTQLIIYNAAPFTRGFLQSEDDYVQVPLLIKLFPHYPVGPFIFKVSLLNPTVIHLICCMLFYSIYCIVSVPLVV